jgi:hypothetical protein
MNEQDMNQRSSRGLENLPDPKKRNYFLWLLVGLIPIPVGLLIGPTRIFDSAAGHDKSLFLFFALMTVWFSLICGMGLSAAFVTKKLSDILAGILAGLGIGAVCVFVVFFAGCCSAFSHI